MSGTRVISLLEPLVKSTTWHWIAGVVVLMSASAQALEPGDIAVVFNTKSPGSLAVARYYMKVRQIPANHLIPLTCDASENISEADYRGMVVPQLLKALKEHRLLADPVAGTPGIKCLVTTYDVPLRILAHEPSAAEKVEIAEDQKALDDATADIAAHIRLYDSLAPAATLPDTRPAAAPATAATAPAQPTWQELLPRYAAADSAAARRIEKLSEVQRARETELQMELVEHLEGTGGLINKFSVPANATGPSADRARQHMADLAAELKDDQQQYRALLPQRDSPRIRQEIINLRLKADGIFGQARALDEMLAYLRPDQTAACFDNELTLLLADQNYTRALWLANPRNLELYPQLQRPGIAVPPTLLVCRIDGITPAKAQELVDRAVEVEAKGLEGKLYLDARGLRGADPYAAYDADIRKTADWMKLHSTMETVLDDNPALLVAKDCPDAALYCGWYSLHNYQESCQWVKGAVGYHVASLEMMSLHTPKETGWVPNLLARGFAGTVGPTDEPYLQSFAKPSQFFPLLLSGEFTQGEVWEVTCPLLSWREGFVGDPLYNPFKAKPRVKLDDLRADPVLRNAFVILGHDVR